MPAVVALAAVLIASCGGQPGTGVAQQDRDVEQMTGGRAGVVEDRCDLGFNTATFNDTAAPEPQGHDHAGARGQAGAGGPAAVDFTLDQWAAVFVDQDLGMTVDDVLRRLDADDVYRRHVLGGVLTHTLGPDPWVPMTDGRACEVLADELQAAREAATRYPTVADALLDGYTLGDRYYAGLGVHYQNWSYLGSFDPGRPVQLLFDGTDEDSTLVGLSYVVRLPGTAPPEGFTGENDRWHRHSSFCLDLEHGAVNLSADVLTPAECAALSGSFTPNPDLWMLHAWLVPGCESDWGLFSAANPRLPYIADGMGLASGCNSGKALADEIDFDERGSGPDIT